MSEVVYNDEIPVGGIFPWHKDEGNTPSIPDGYVECNGQTLSDSESPLDGQTIPNINGNNEFVRGNTSSGSTGGVSSNDLTHTHSVGTNEIEDYGSDYYDFTSLDNALGVYDNEPPYMDMVYVMRVK